MAVSLYTKLRDKLRVSIRDSHLLAWSDTQLDQVITDSIREYSLYSGSCVGSFDLIGNDTGVITVPGDYLKPVKFIGVDGFERPFLSWKRLDKYGRDFRNEKSDYLQGLIVDLDGFGKIRLYPIVDNGKLGTLYYQKLATDNINFDAVEQCALAYLFLLSENDSASVYYNNFLNCIKKEKSIQRGLTARSNFRNNRFY